MWKSLCAMKARYSELDRMEWHAKDSINLDVPDASFDVVCSSSQEVSVRPSVGWHFFDGDWTRGGVTPLLLFIDPPIVHCMAQRPPSSGSE